MKKHIVLFTSLLVLTFALQAQEINWRATTDASPNLASIHMGAHFGTTYGLAYGRHFNASLPWVVGAELEIPFGKDLLDDWKFGVNLQTELWQNDHLSLAIKPGLILRRYQSKAARIYNVGTEFTTTIGYFRPSHGLALEMNYDRTFFSHLEHEELMEQYPSIGNGWFGSSGGNLKFGVLLNYNVRNWGFFLKTGKIYAQNFQDNPTLPFYFKLTAQKRF